MGPEAVLFLIQELSGNDTVSWIGRPSRMERMHLSGRSEYRKPGRMQGLNRSSLSFIIL